MLYSPTVRTTIIAHIAKFLIFITYKIRINFNLTIVKLIISYELPKALARFMKEDILGKLVTNELQNNLDNFKKLVESEVKIFE